MAERFSLLAGREWHAGKMSEKEVRQCANEAVCGARSAGSVAWWKSCYVMLFAQNAAPRTERNGKEAEASSEKTYRGRAVSAGSRHRRAMW